MCIMILPKPLQAGNMGTTKELLQEGYVILHKVKVLQGDIYHVLVQTSADEDVVYAAVDASYNQESSRYTGEFNLFNYFLGSVTCVVVPTVHSHHDSLELASFPSLSVSL